MSMSFVSKNPDQKSKLSGFNVKPVEYNGTVQIGGFEFHSWKCEFISKADDTVLGSRNLITATTGANALGPEDLQVDEETGYLDESVNKLQRANARGEQNMIVKVGSGLEMPEGIGIKAGQGW